MTKDMVYEYIPKYLKGRTLDVGAGNMKYKEFIEQHCNEYLTLDIQGDVDYIASADNMPIKNNSFDSILSFQMFEHVEKPKEIVSEMYRILRNNGVAIVTVPFMCPEHADPYDFQRYTPNGLVALFDYKNFEVVESMKYTGPYTVAIDFIKFYFFNPYLSSTKRRKVGNFLIPKLLRIAKYLDKNKIDSNIFGYSMIVVRKVE